MSLFLLFGLEQELLLLDCVSLGEVGGVLVLGRDIKMSFVGLQLTVDSLEMGDDLVLLLELLAQGRLGRASLVGLLGEHGQFLFVTGILLLTLLEPVVETLQTFLVTQDLVLEF